MSRLTRFVALMFALVLLVDGLGSSTALANHTQCSDALDNDGDGKADFPLDPQCDTPEDNSEGGTTSSASSSSSSASSNTFTIMVDDGKSSIRAGDSMVYLIELKQTSEPSKTVDVDLYLPTFANIVSPQQGGNATGNRVRWNNIVLLQNVTQRLSVNVSLNPVIPENTDLIARAVAAGFEATDSTVIRSTSSNDANFTLTLSDGKATAAPNDMLTQTFTVKNTSSQQRTTDVQLTTSQFVAIESVNPITATDSNVLMWKSQNFAAGEIKTYTVKGTIRRGAPEYASIVFQGKVGTVTATDVTSVQTKTSSSSRSSSSSSHRSNSSSSRVATQNDRLRNVLFTKTADMREVVPGGVITYTLQVQNVLLTVIDDAMVSDKFDVAQITIIDAAGGVMPAAGQLEWKLPTLNPGEIWTRSYKVQVAQGLQSGTDISNVASITGNDVSYTTLDEKVTVAQTNVVGKLPPTGAPYDVLLNGLSIVFAAGLTALQRRRV